MYINEALTRLKNLKSKIARVEGYIENSAVYYEDVKPDHVYKEELFNRAQLNSDILKLKTAIQITNANTKVKYKNEWITLAELILRNAQLRSELSFVAKQMKHTTASERSSIFDKRTKDDVKKLLAEGVDKQMFKAAIDELEHAKEDIEAVMAHANASTTLLE